MDALIVSHVVLWIVVVALALVVLALTRQIGVLHERVSPAGALTLSGGVKAGETVPAMSLPTLSGSNLAIESFAARQRGVLVFFLSPTCPVCKSLLPVVTRIAKEERKWLDLVFASDGGTKAEHEAYVTDRQLQSFPYVISQELGMAFQVGKLPYAALIDESGVLVAKGLVNTREHIESLFEAKRLGVASINEFIRANARDESEVKA
ncbi:MAG: methylamine dehydrogenase accessory protein MauD [Gammaproteobacteria bacterium]|nr:methylamine dehydrogenase accessory protein MauD [Gammaproteobacteria bacterium]